MADIRDKDLDNIFGRSTLTIEALLSNLRDDVRRLVIRRRGDSTGEILTAIRGILTEFEPVMIDALTDAQLAAAVTGAQQIADGLPVEALARLRAISPPRPPGFIQTPFGQGAGDEPLLSFPVIERAAESLLERNIATRATFDQMGREARARAFTVARLNTEDAIETVRDVLAESVREGTTLRQFRKTLDERLEGSYIGPAHAELVFRNGIQTAFNAAHDELASRPIVAEIFPYQKYLPISDGRVRQGHLDLARQGIDGTNIYRRADRDFWQIFTPPIEWACRCGVNLMTIEAAARRGVREAQRWLETGAEPPLVSRLPDIPFRPDPDFVGGRRARSVA